MEEIKIWVFAAKFPSTIQPWLANIVAQVPRQGGEVKIFSMGEGDSMYAGIVDEYELKSRTVVLNYEGFGSLRTIFANFANPKVMVSSLLGLVSAHQYGSKHKSRFSNLIAGLVLAPLLRRGDVDVIHSHFETTGHKLLPVVRAQKVPFVVTFHGLPPPGVASLSDLRRREYVSAASVILVNTEFAKRQYVQLGADANKIRTLPQGTDTRKFSFYPKPFPIHGKIRILTVGRFQPDKGQEYALRAVASVAAAGISLEYTLVGSGPDKCRLEALAAELGISNITKFKSNLSEGELIRHYQEAHIFLFASLRARDGFHEETQGVALQEAQACGAIVVATRTGGIPECIIDGDSAFLVEDRNVKELADKIEWIIGHPENWDTWQRRARRYVEDIYDIDVIGEKMMNIYRELRDKRFAAGEASEVCIS